MRGKSTTYIIFTKKWMPNVNNALLMINNDAY